VTPSTILAGTALSGTFAAAANVWLSTGTTDQPGRLPFVLLQFVLGACLACYGLVALEVIPAELAVVALVLGQAPSLVLWGVFAATYTGRGPIVTRRRAAVLCAGVALVIVDSLLTEFIDGLFRTVTATTAALLWSLLVFGCLYGVFLLVWSTLATDELSIGAGGLTALCGTLLALVPLVAAVALEFFVPLMTAGTTLVAVGLLAVQLRYRPFTGPPAMGQLARDSVFDAVSDAVIVVDRRRRVVDANTVAERTFGIRLVEVVGRPLDEVLASDPDGRDGDAADPVSLKTTEGNRSFRVTRSRLENDEDERIGRAYVFRDVTDQRTREQQLEVLNRVLRHNLRNDLDAIRGFAETLGDATDDDGIDTATVADRIRSLSRELSETGATVERAERLRTRETLARDPTDVDALLESLAAEVRRNHPDCTVSVSTADTRLRTDETVLETVLREVGENAIEHNDAPEPTVELVATPTDEGVEIAVRDDGDGIPEREREILLDGEPTQLRHSTGIGLWLVSWGVTRLGGELAFDDADTGGTVVTLSIPDREPAGTDAEDAETTDTADTDDTPDSTSAADVLNVDPGAADSTDTTCVDPTAATRTEPEQPTEHST